MKILAIDAAKSCGWALGDLAGCPLSGVWKLPALNASGFASLYASIRFMVATNNVEGVVIEAPLARVFRTNKRGIDVPSSAHGDQTLAMLSGAAQAAAMNGGAKWIEMPMPHIWRKAILGNGYPKNPKQAAFDFCRLMKWPVTEHDAAEALCLMRYGHDMAARNALL